MYFHSKMGWPPATYDVISRNHRNWSSLNLTQNARKGWTNRYWQHQVLMVYPLRKNSEKPWWGGGTLSPTTPLNVRGLRIQCGRRSLGRSAKFNLRGGQKYLSYSLLGAWGIAGFQCHAIQNRSQQKSTPFNRLSPESGKRQEVNIPSSSQR